MKSNKCYKNDRINFRLSSNQKADIHLKAEAVGMSISQYLLHLAENGSITIIDGKDLAAEVYKLNQKLNKLDRYPALPVQELRDVISQGIVNISNMVGE